MVEVGWGFKGIGMEWLFSEGRERRKSSAIEGRHSERVRGGELEDLGVLYFRLRI